MSPLDSDVLVGRYVEPGASAHCGNPGQGADEPVLVDGTTKLRNPQLYENSPLSGSLIEQHYEHDPQKLFSDRQPNLAVLHEKPEHRLMCTLKIQGFSNREIAAKMECTEAWVSQVLRQPWARQYMIQELNGAGRQALDVVLKANAMDSVFTLVELRDNASVPPAVRRAAADSLLDRYLGKPTQRTENVNVNATPGDLAEMQKEIDALKVEEARLTGGVPV